MILKKGKWLGKGSVLAEGSVEDVKNNEEVIEAYLGRGMKNKPVTASA